MSEYLFYDGNIIITHEILYVNTTFSRTCDTKLDIYVLVDNLDAI